MIAPPPEQLWQKLEEYTPQKLVKAWPFLAEELRLEIRRDFDHALRKSIGKLKISRHRLPFEMYHLKVIDFESDQNAVRVDVKLKERDLL